jgi:hypothetical protein
VRKYPTTECAHLDFPKAIVPSSEGSGCPDLDYIRDLTQQGISTLLESRGPLRPLQGPLCDERDDLAVQDGDQFEP